MKKFIRGCVLTALAALMVVSFTACSKFGSVKKAFEKDGFAYSEETNDNVSKIKEELKDSEGNEIPVTPHVFTKTDALKSAIVIVLEFKSTEDLDKALEQSATLKGLLKDLEKSSFVNGNCVCVPISLDAAHILEVFKNA